MCYNVDAKYTKKDLEDTFNVEANFNTWNGEKILSGFRAKGTVEKPLPIITDENPDAAVIGDWGLLPLFSKDRSFQSKTLNAVIEELDIKNSYKNSINKRCLVLVNGFYEWRSLDKFGNPDPEGKIKQLHRIRLNNNDKPFALAGIYNVWNDIVTFSICTTKANTLMAEIHNSKKRMPVVLNERDHQNWLFNEDYMHFYHPTYNVDLIFENLEPNKTPNTLF
ncbi:Putative SOS response-associated peptidase YedK [Chryseobacterium oranimense]|uniref:Abasic site processing protein n=1 Tax=Chryseobacterium oranimense TaxID=421058 RepID=A0A1M5UZT3_9FLAO|nr:SOS response-associated peptidase family protein [Chryseobacterium oranimense]SHH68512.1 Putative SOS response-associated peptidase YedK [Chryseobacterium oranimense]